MITIYKTPTCAYCHQTASYLDKKGVAYEMIDVSERHNQEYANLASLYGHTVPLVTNGVDTFCGWNLAKLNAMIAK